GLSDCRNKWLAAPPGRSRDRPCTAEYPRRRRGVLLQHPAARHLRCASDSAREMAPAVAPSDELISTAASQPAFSANGRYVAFTSRDGSPWDVYVKDRQTGTYTPVSRGANGDLPDSRYSAQPSLSADGRFLAYLSLPDHLVPGDTNH